MLVIRQDQVEIFRRAARAGFETKLLARAREFAPRLAAVLGPDALRLAIRAAIERAESHELTQQGPARLFVEMTMLFGSDFDTDPQYPWAAEILAGPPRDDPIRRAEKLYDQTIAYQRDVLGPDNTYALAALEALVARARQDAAIPAEDFEDFMAGEVTRVYPQKAADLGAATLRAVVGDGMRAARARGLASPRGMALAVALRLGFGHGCFDDPFYPWIARTFRDESDADPAARAERLERRALGWLDQVIAGAREDARA